MNDEEAIIYLSKLRQIGRWSAEMILLFTYNRSNIWPIQDIGLLRAISKIIKKIFASRKVRKFIKKKFSPYCSVAGIFGEVLILSLFSTKSSTICMCLVVVSLAKFQPA